MLLLMDAPDAPESAEPESLLEGISTAPPPTNVAAAASSSGDSAAEGPIPRRCDMSTCGMGVGDGIVDTEAAVEDAVASGCCCCCCCCSSCWPRSASRGAAASTTTAPMARGGSRDLLNAFPRRAVRSGGGAPWSVAGVECWCCCPCDGDEAIWREALKPWEWGWR